MKLKADESKCDKCGLCFKECPQLCGTENPNIFFCEQNECKEKECLHACEKKAILEVDGFCYIDYDKCDQCGRCAQACDAIAMCEGFPVKCNLCGKCIGACPQKALSFEYSKKELAELRENVGWWKSPNEILEVIEETTDYLLAVISGKDKPVLLLKVDGVSYGEMHVLGKILDSLREAETGYDAATFEKQITTCCEDFGAGQNAGKLIETVKHEVLGFSILDKLLEADWLEEIAVSDGPLRVYHKKYGWLETDLFITDKKIVSIVNKISKPLWRRLTLQNPRLNACLDFGRIHAAIPPVTKSPCLTIRKFNKTPFSAHELIKNRMISSEALAFLWMATQCDSNVLLAGNTGSGKTSLLNTLSCFIPENERIIIVEETPEVNLPHQHQVQLTVNESLKISMADLVADTLRMRPDRVIVGEVRTPEEAKAFANTMLAGQGKSSFATFHAQNAREAMLRLVNLGVNKCDLCAFDYIIVVRRWTDFGKNRDIRRVVEVARMNKELDGIETLFAFDPKKDVLKRTGNLFSSKIGYALGLSGKTFENELLRRKGFLEKSLSFSEFFRVINDGPV